MAKATRSSQSVSVDVLTRRQFMVDAAAMGSVVTILPLEAIANVRREATGTRETSFDLDWRFFRGEAPGPERYDFDDAAWRRLDVPHDWSIEDRPGAPNSSAPWSAPAALWSESARGTPAPGEIVVWPTVPPAAPGSAPTKVGPFDAEESPGGFATAWTLGGTSWYRKHFSVSSPHSDEQFEVRFDGVCIETEVWLNGVLLGSHVNGYTGFAFDLTPHLHHDAVNVLAVRVRNEGKTSRWYSGSGIYRHVWLTKTGPVRVPLWGVSVKTPAVTSQQARIQLAVEIENRASADRAVQVTATIKNAAERIIASSSQLANMATHSNSRVDFDFTVHSPQLWSPTSPVLHRAEVVLTVANEVMDTVQTHFGIRTIEVDAQSGLRINGQSIKLKGACMHDDNGLLGAVAIDRAEVRKIELLKANGFNAIRCSHNPYAPRFLDACDELGMLVIDEVFDAWEVPKTPDDHAKYFKGHWQEDLSAMIRRDRNHPSIIFWSLGNEIPERNEPRGVEIAASLREAVLKLDTSRPITAALAPMVSGAAAEPSRRHLDVVGYNYMSAAYEADHAANPNTIFMGTEQYASDIYDAWQKVEKYPWVIGDFVWTGMDYLGEAGSGSSQLRRDGEQAPATPLPFSIYLWDYPAILSGCGEIDLLGLKKPQSYYRDVLWHRSPLELFVQRPIPMGMHEEVGNWGWHDELASWTWPGMSAKSVTVRAYTYGDEVRLLLNGREVSRKTLTPADRLTAEVQVDFQPGELTAIALAEGKEISRKSLVTVSAPAKVRLRAEQARLKRSRNDLTYVFAEVCDAHGDLVPDAMLRLSFEVEGPAKLRAAGSANPRGVESFFDASCTTFHGVALAIISPVGRRGEARLKVTAPGLRGDSILIQIG